jgi:hypothetical protein
MRQIILKMGFVMAVVVPSFAISPVHAQGLDMARMTCSQFQDMRPADRQQIGVWLHGYYAGSANKPMIDTNAYEGALRTLNEACTKQKTAPLIGDQVRGIFLPNATPNNTQPSSNLTNSAVVPLNQGAQTVSVPRDVNASSLTTGSLPAPSTAASPQGVNSQGVTIPVTGNTKPAPR